MKLAVICARVSSEDPHQERLDDQLAECRKWAEEHGYRIVTEVVENGVSGGLAVEERPQLSKAIEQLRAGHIQALITRELDRLGRRLDTAALVEELSAYGDGVQFVRQPRLDDPEAEIIQTGLGGLMARLERQRIYRRTSQGRNRRAREGKSTIGLLPSWLRVIDNEFVLVDDDARRVTSILSEFGRVGGYTLAKDQGMNPSSIMHILNNPAVAGRRYVSELPSKAVGKSERQRLRRAALREICLATTPEEADAIADRHSMILQKVPALISWERFADIQMRLLQMGGAQRGRPPKERLPLQGRIRCAIHGLAYTPHRPSTGVIHAECTARRGHNARQYGKCVTPRLPWMEDTRRSTSLVGLVRSALERALETPAAIERATNDYIGTLEEQVDKLESEAGHADGEVEKLTTKLERISLLWADGSISDEAFQGEKRRIENHLRQAKDLVRLEADCLRALANARQSLRLAAAARPIGLRPGVTFVNMNDENEFNEFIERFNVRIIVEQSRIRVEGLVPFDDIPLETAPKNSKSS